MDAERVLALLADACLTLEQAGEHAAAAYVGHAISLLEDRYGAAQGTEPSQHGGDGI